MVIVPSSIQAVPSKGLIDKPLILNNLTPLSTVDRDERLRAYHARLDLLNAMIKPEADDLDWQVENITDWKFDKQLMLKVTWIGGDKQWVSMDDIRLHDPYVIIKYGLKHKLTDKLGWKWAKNYVEFNKTLNNMVHAYKTSKYIITSSLKLKYLEAPNLPFN